MRVLLALVLAFTAVMAAPKASTRIIGGEPVGIRKYPQMVSILYDNLLTRYNHIGAGVILNNRAILTGAHMFYQRNTPAAFKYRAGSTFNNVGGQVLDTLRITQHPNYKFFPVENDIAIAHVLGVFLFTDVVQPATIAGPTYPLPDNDVVWAAGWGYTDPSGPAVHELHHVQIWTVNREVCRQRFSKIGYNITEDMVCAGVLDIGGRDQCDEDTGGPLIHKGTVVGINTIYRTCGSELFPGVNIRVSSYTDFIISNA